MDDSISRKAALDALGEAPEVWMDTPEEFAALNQWEMDVAAIKAVPSADRPRWIPCSERLPRYDETSEYLITDKEGRVRHCCLDLYMPETFVTVEEGMIVDAVAWRPAPEPWKERQNERMD